MASVTINLKYLHCNSNQIKNDHEKSLQSSTNRLQKNNNGFLTILCLNLGWNELTLQTNFPHATFFLSTCARAIREQSAKDNELNNIIIEFPTKLLTLLLASVAIYSAKKFLRNDTFFHDDDSNVCNKNKNKKILLKVKEPKL